MTARLPTWMLGWLRARAAAPLPVSTTPSSVYRSMYPLWAWRCTVTLPAPDAQGLADGAGRELPRG